MAECKSGTIVKLRNALRHLVILKKYKDRHGKDKHYAEQQPIAWENAIKILKEIDPEEQFGGL